jgi:glycosyltransferase involved in cell wall biosynthesis
VPVYNVERYLEQCLESIVAQSLRDIEIICINDGSSDGSGAILQSFAAADERIEVLTVANGGYGRALNLGLERATGSYISIIESDDFVEPDMLETLYTAALSAQAQLAKADFWLSWSDATKDSPAREKYFSAVPEDLAGRVVAPWREWRVIQPQPAIWSGLYRRSFLADNNIRFAESPGASFQDSCFNYQVFSAAERATLIGRALVHYRQDNAASSVNATTKVFAVRAQMERYFAWLEAWEAASMGRRQERAAHLRLVMQGIVYKTYRWNIRRIAKDLRPDFLAYMHEYFCQAQAAGMLHREYFEEDGFAEVQLLIRNPEKYLEITNMLISPGNRFSKLCYYLRAEGLRLTLQRALGRR